MMMPVQRLVAAALVLLCCFLGLVESSPEPPLWDLTFKFIASALNTTTNYSTSVQYHYRWDIPAVAQVNANDLGDEYTILHVKTNTWRVSPGKKTCCLCTDPTSCGHVTPPMPTWLRQGNETQYIGVTAINERECDGWVKGNSVARFGWWTSVKTNIPCQLSWLLGTTVNMVISYYTNDPTLVPAAIFEVPSYCPYQETTPDCSIAGF